MEYRELLTVEDKFEADVIVEALEKECIPFKLSPNEELTLEPVFHLQRPYGSILVPDSFRDQALEVIEAVLKAPPLAENEPLPEGLEADALATDPVD